MSAVEPSQQQEESYAKAMRRTSIFLSLLILCWLPEIALSQSPVIAIAISALVASVLILLLSYSQFQVDRKRKHVTATTRDYFQSNTYLYLIALLPGLVLLGFYYFLPRFGILTLIYIDGSLLGIMLFLARFPLALRLGQKATQITDITLLSSFSGLASKMGVPVVGLYSIDWRRFKVANAFQAGPRRFSIFVSTHLLDNMTTEEVSAVMAHELAHARKRHVLKVIALVLSIGMIGLDLLVVAVILGQAPFVSPSWLMFPPMLAGLAIVFLGPQLALRLQRKFEFEADEIAVKTMGDATAMISALKKLADLNLVPAETKSGTHPSMAQRIQRIEQLTKG